MEELRNDIMERFMPFCEQIESEKFDTATPWVRKGYVYATDCSLCVRQISAAEDSDRERRPGAWKLFGAFPSYAQFQPLEKFSAHEIRGIYLTEIHGEFYELCLLMKLVRFGPLYVATPMENSALPVLAGDVQALLMPVRGAP